MHDLRGVGEGMGGGNCKRVLIFVLKLGGLLKFDTTI